MLILLLNAEFLQSISSTDCLLDDIIILQSPMKIPFD